MITNLRGAELHRKHVVLQQPLTDSERVELDAWYAQMDAMTGDLLPSDASEHGAPVPENQSFSLESGKVQRGRLIVITVIAAVLFLSISILIVGALQSTTSPFAIVRLALTIGLCVMLWRGHSWARWLAAVLFGLGGVAGILVLTSSATAKQPAVGTLMLFMAIIYFVISASLILSSDVRAFMAFQRKEYS
ncbi:MAG: hypothetical protein ACR2FY_25530 [Pirellulaceae bacterium]